MKIIIETNIPAIIVNVWNGHFQWVIKDLRGPANNVIPYFRSSHTDYKPEETKTQVEFELPQGLFSLRISLPYISWEKEFQMPMIMDHYLTVKDGDEPQIISFCAALTEVTHKVKTTSDDYQIIAISVNGKEWRLGNRVKNEWGQYGSIVGFDDINDGWNVMVNMDTTGDTLYNVKLLELL